MMLSNGFGLYPSGLNLFLSGFRIRIIIPDFHVSGNISSFHIIMHIIILIITDAFRVGTGRLMRGQL